MVASQPAPAPLTPEHPFIATAVRHIKQVYGDHLRALALFGSVARRTARSDSDVDLLVVVDDLPRGRRARFETFAPVERSLAPAMAELRAAGITTELSAVLRTPEDLRTASPLMLDLTEDAVVFADPDGLLAAALDDLRARLRRLGSRRVWTGDTWYWDLKPDYRRGEIIRL